MEYFQKTFLIIILIILFGSNGITQSERSLARKGNRFYKEKNYTDAEVNYRKSLEKNKEFKEGIFNLGNTLYKQERFDDASEQFRIAATRATDKKTKAQALHNLGNSLLKANKIPESINAYKDALKLNPNDVDTKYNLEYAKTLLKKQEQQQQQQDKKNNQEQNQNQEQQKQDTNNNEQQQQNQQQKQKQQIEKEDAERILEALNREEQNIQKKLQKKVPERVKIEKDW